MITKDIVKLLLDLGLSLELEVLKNFGIETWARYQSVNIKHALRMLDINQNLDGGHDHHLNFNEVEHNAHNINNLNNEAAQQLHGAAIAAHQQMF